MSPVEQDRMRAVEDSWLYRALRKEVARMMHPPRPDSSVLDAGCGSGGMLASRARFFPSAGPVEMDLSEHALTLAASRPTGATLAAATANQLPFPRFQFDFVLSHDVFTDRGVGNQAAVREADRVLQPSGQLIVNVADFDSLEGSHDVAVELDRRYTRLQSAGLLREAGSCISRFTY
jgi:ubiquinone/menaquinone biosynthesis C-methylase UbiE